MKQTQRVLLLMAAVLCILFGTILYSRKEMKLQNQWEKQQTELFLEKVCRNGSLLLEDYMKYAAGLNYSGVISEVLIEEYQKEQDMWGKGYYHLVSGMEIKEHLMEDAVWRFHEESVVKITVMRKGKGKQRISDYYGIISGKETG